MKRHTLQIAALLLLLTGLGIFVYPYIGEWLLTREMARTAVAFEAAAAAPQGDAAPLLEALYERMQRENRRLWEEGQQTLADPFAHTQPGINLAHYGIEENIVATLTIPKLEQTLPVALGASEENMEQGAVHLTGSSYPIGGENTNTVIAAHRGFYKADMFKNIQLLEVGDAVQVQNFRETLEYNVSAIAIIAPTDVESVYILPGEDLLTLFTCHPYGSNAQRYLVTCKRVVGHP